jgi:hypothetical protein
MLLSFPPATEMFQFAGFASSSYGFTEGYRLRGGLPHSDIPGSTSARLSPGLFAACHVLHRLSVPRHPPDALLLQSSPTPSPKRANRALKPRSRDQMSEIRCQKDPRRLSGRRLSSCSLSSVLCSLSQDASRQGARPGVSIPMSIRHDVPPARARTPTSLRLAPCGHDSLCTMSDIRGQMSDVRGWSGPRRCRPLLTSEL